MKFLSVTIIFLAASFLPAVQADTNDIPFPDDYRSAFTNYLSLDRTLNPDQVIRLFANETAMQGPDADGKFPYGSVLVGEIYTVKKDADGKIIESDLGRRIKDKLALIAVMKRGEGFGKNVPEGLKNGDWDFAAYKPDGSAADKDLNACRGCHAPLVDSNHLFSYDHLN